jgi:Na+-driven multidrug efflux pump
VALGGSFAGMIVTLCFISLWWRGKFNLKLMRIDRATVRQLVSIGTPAMLEQGWCRAASGFFECRPVWHRGLCGYGTA